MAKYEPAVRCDSEPEAPSWTSCVSIFTNMRANSRLAVFGYYDQEGIDMGLPYILEAGEKGTTCYHHIVLFYVLSISLRGKKYRS